MMRKEGTEEGLGSMKEVRDGPKMDDAALTPPPALVLAARPKRARVLPEQVVVEEEEMEEEELGRAPVELRLMFMAAAEAAAPLPSAAFPSSALIVALLS